MEQQDEKNIRALVPKASEYRNSRKWKSRRTSKLMTLVKIVIMWVMEGYSGKEIWIYVLIVDVFFIYGK